MDRLRSMSVVLAVAAGGSLSAAARKLGMPLPTVSRHVSELETHLKARLFNRSTRRLELTAAGNEYLIACKRILEEVDDAERAAAGEFNAPRGDLIVSAPIVFGRVHVLPVIMEFLKNYREVNVRLILNDRVIDLLNDHVDVAVRIGELQVSGLIASRIGLTHRVVCASPSYLAQCGEPVQPTDLVHHQCIDFDGMSTQDTWIFRSDHAEVAVQIHPRLIVNTAEAAIDAAIAGGGLTRVLSYQIAPAVTQGALATVLAKFEPAPAPIHLVHAGTSRMPRKLRVFLDFAAPCLRARLRE
jgi:DNA-binding transcriptional LysR family regulator